MFEWPYKFTRIKVELNTVFRALNLNGFGRSRWLIEVTTTENIERTHHAVRLDDELKLKRQQRLKVY